MFLPLQYFHAAAHPFQGGVLTLVPFIGALGLMDMSRWKTESHFASWLGLCPDNRISGDKVLSRGTRRVINRAATALRIAASTLIRSKTYLGAQCRRLRTKLGAPNAITAMAHRLERLVYRMLKYAKSMLIKVLPTPSRGVASSKSTS
jgi:transposase